jgi:uncharacterized delta-60 repeat protein
MARGCRHDLPSLRIVLALTGLAAMALIAAASAWSRPGSFDPTFSGNGIAFTGFKPGGEGKAGPRGMAVQANGRIVIAGYVPGVADDGDFGLARFRRSGKLDDSFGNRGTAQIDFGAAEYAGDVAVQRDGRIVVAGSSYAQSGESEVAVSRLNPDGSLDGSFGDGGKAVLDLAGAPPAQALASSVAVTPGGSIIVGGALLPDPDSDDRPGFVARLKPGGGLDPLFGDGGVKSIAFRGFDAGAPVGDLVLEPGVRIALVAEATRHRGTTAAAVARLSLDSGHYDRSFSRDGRKTLIDRSYPSSIARAGRGSLVAVGTAGDDMFVARLKLGGGLDRSFAGDGIKVTRAGAGQNVYDVGASGVAVQGDGKAVVAATLGPFPNRPAVVRLRRSGRLDRSFAGDGSKVIGIRGESGVVALQENGKILLSGYANPQAFVARLENDALPAGG